MDREYRFVFIIKQINMDMYVRLYTQINHVYESQHLLPSLSRKLEKLTRPQNVISIFQRMESSHPIV
jgi:hypothetical protein